MLSTLMEKGWLPLLLMLSVSLRARNSINSGVPVAPVAPVVPVAPVAPVDPAALPAITARGEWPTSESYVTDGKICFYISAILHDNQ
uniref:Putative secreted protein n=1 Tax=Anopheles triannulatus TaxID=58253 RepID=A0A2M4B5C2_9DIPT